MEYALATDLYQLNMMYVYFKDGMKDDISVFDVFFRVNPFNKGYGLMGCLNKVIELVKNIRFREEDIEYLRGLGFYDEEFLTYLKNFKFHGDIYSAVDGTPVFAGEPVLTVKAPLAEAQLIETVILSYLNSGILYTTAARRMVEAAGEIGISEFGLRRALGPETGVMASTCAIVAGCGSTSNLLAGKKNGAPVSGTMSHSYVLSFPSESEAFDAYARIFPDGTVVLVDTHDVLNSGVPNAISTAEYLKSEGHELKGIRIDSGDLVELTITARKMLAEAGYPNVKIFVSNGLTEAEILRLKAAGAQIDGIGAGDNIVLPEGARVGCVYKLAAKVMKNEKDLAPKMKATDDPAKANIPGFKRVYRLFDVNGLALGDVISLYDEEIPLDGVDVVDPFSGDIVHITNYTIREVQQTIFKDGVLVYNEPTLLEKQQYCNWSMSTLPVGVKAFNPVRHPVFMTKDVWQLKNDMYAQAKGKKPKEEVLVKA